MKLRAVLRINEIRRNVTKNSMQLFQNLSSRLLNILNIFDCHFTSFILHKFSCWKIVCSVRYLFLRKRSRRNNFWTSFKCKEAIEQRIYRHLRIRDGHGDWRLRFLSLLKAYLVKGVGSFCRWIFPLFISVFSRRELSRGRCKFSSFYLAASIRYRAETTRQISTCRSDLRLSFISSPFAPSSKTPNTQRNSTFSLL